VARTAELIDEGIRAFTRGLFAEAERCWRAALDLEPGNERARTYLAQLQGGSARPGSQAPGQGNGRPETAAGTAQAPGGRAAAAAPRPATTPAPRPAMTPAPRPEMTPAPRPLPPGVMRPVTPPAGRPAPPDATRPEDFARSPWDDGPALSATVVLDPDGGLDLDVVSEKSGLRPLIPEQRDKEAGPRSDVDVWMEGARELFALGDFSGSLEMIEKVLKAEPNHAEAWAYLRQNESTLVAMYESKLGPLAGTPRLAIKPEEVMWLNLDHRAGFLLAQVDGTVSYEDLFALSGLPRLDTAKILATLLGDGVIQ
jgi:tetratricopeptide (TPR) repeat protein